jgi:hypothetical protein
MFDPVSLLAGVLTCGIPSGLIIWKYKKAFKMLSNVGVSSRKLLDDGGVTLGDLINRPEDVPLKVLASLPKSKFDQIIDYLKEARKYATTSQQPSGGGFDLMKIWNKVPMFLRPIIESWVKANFGVDIQQILQNPEMIMAILESIKPPKEPEKMKEVQKETMQKLEEIPLDTESFEKYMKEKYGINVAVR